MAGLNFDITGDNSNFLRRLEEAKSGIASTSKQIEKEGTSIEAMFGRMAKGAAVLGLGFSATQLINDIIRVRGEFQQLEIAFETMLKSKEKASALMAQLTDTAAKTPFDLQSVAQGAKQLLAYGTASEEVNDTLVRLGNIASGLSIPLGDLVYLYGTTQTQGRLFTQDVRQFMGRGIPLVKELATELGKSEQQINEMVTAGKIGFPEVEKVIRNMTGESGQFYNLMEKQSASLTGQISNLGDAWDGMLNKLGTQTQGIASAGISATTSLIENYEEVGKILAGLVVVYGTYRTAVMLVAAAQSLQAAGIGVLTAKEAIHYAWLVATKKAQLALNAAMLTNPYVLLATAVVGVAAAIWTFADHTSAAEKTAKTAAKAMENMADASNKLKNKINELLATIRDETATQYDKASAYLKLQKIMPDVFKNMDIEKLKLMDELSLREKINEAANISNIVEAKTNMVIAQRKHDTASAKHKKDTDNGLVGAGSLAEKNESFMELEAAKKVVSEIEKIQSEANKQKGKEGKKVVVENKEFWDKQKKDAETALDSIDSKQRKLLNAGKFDSIDAAVVSNYKNQSKLLEEAQKELKVYDTSGKSEKQQESAAEKLRKEQAKYALLLDKQSREQKRMEEDSANELEQLEIDRLKEGSEKVLMQRALNHKKELEAIEREAQDKKAKAIEEGRTAHEANPDNKKKPFNAEDFIKSEPVKKQFASFDNVATVKTKTANTQYNRGDDLSGLLNEYQDYTDKRLAIETKFNNDLAVLDEQRKQAVKNGDTQQVEQIDRAKAQATTDKGKSLMGMDYDKLKESPEYVRAFENLKETSSETLSSLLSQLENAKGAAAKVLSPDQLREYTTTIQEIMNELDERNPFQALVDRKKELAEAENELAEAKRNLDKVNAGGKVASGTKFNEKTGKVDTTYLTAEQALLKYNKAKDKTVKADAKLVKAEKESLEVVEKLADSFKEIGDSIGGTTGEIIGLMGDITSFTTLCMTGMSNVSKTASAQMQAVEKASVILGIISAAIQLMQKLNSILPTADSQYEQYAAKLEEINKLTDAINEYKIAALEAQHAEEGWFSDDNLKNLRNYKELHDEVTKAYNTKADESQALYQEKSGGGWVTNSWNWLLDNTYGRIYDVDFARQYEEGQTAAMNNLRIETRERSKGFLGSGIGGKSQKTEDLVSWARNNGFGELFDDKGLINKEAANSILNQYGDKLVGQTKETLESLTKLREKYDEYIQQLHEYVSTLYEPLVDNFVDGIWDWLDSGKNALDSFKEYASDTFRDIVSDMMKTIALEKIFNNEDVWGKGESYQSKVSKAYEDYASGLINEAELNKRVSEITQKMLLNAEAQLPAIQGVGENILDTIYKTTGIDLKKSDSESSSQDSTNGGFQAMSQDTGNELNGRFTALQISNEEIKNSMLSMLVSMNLISVSTNTNGITLMEIKNIALMSNSHLEDIAKYTKELIGFKQTIANIETSAKAMAGK